jgi:hypothetical protein
MNVYTQFQHLQNNIKQLFLFEGKVDRVLVTLVLIINSIVLINSIFHHPKIGYDAVDHLSYLQILSDRLPNREDTPEFFSPPFAYILPTIFDKVCETITPGDVIMPMYQGSTISFDCRSHDGKFAQFVNFFLSLGAILLVLAISQQVKPENRYFKISSLLLLGLLTVYYKTFSQVRGEPYVAFLALLSIFFMIRIFQSNLAGIKAAVILGVCLGCLILSRQWGFFILLAIGLCWFWIFLQDRQKGLSYAKVIFPAFAIAILVGGWFYGSLYTRYGTLTAFNKESSGFSLSNVPPTFFTVTRLKNYELFQQPVRPNFTSQFFPTFYSDTWGNYWGFFSYVKTKSSFGDVGLGNDKQIIPYLGRVNLFSTVPTLILIAGILGGLLNLVYLKRPLDPKRMAFGLLTLVVLVSFLGYTWFIVSYYTSDDSTLKAAYIIQLFMAAIFLGADFMESIRQRTKAIYYLLLVMLVAVFLHNLPALITHYDILLVR